MKPAHLTDEQRESFERDGYLHVENVLDSDEIARYTKACDHLIDDFPENIDLETLDILKKITN